MSDVTLKMNVEAVLKYEGMVDTVSRSPLDSEIVSKLASFKTCLVCSERWTRPDDIAAYQEQMKSLDFAPDAVMTASQYAAEWSALFLQHPVEWPLATVHCWPEFLSVLPSVEVADELLYQLVCLSNL